MAKAGKESATHTLKRSGAGRPTVPGQDGRPAVLSRRMQKPLAIFLGILVTLVLSELGLRLLWHNPYHRESPDHLLKVRLHHANTDHIIDRAPLDPENSQVRFRTDARSYILPSFQYSDPRATVAFLGGVYYRGHCCERGYALSCSSFQATS